MLDLNNFPLDIIIDILPKVDVNSLLRFKSVCKSWYSLIDDDKFIKQHYNTRKGDKTGQKYFFAFIDGANRKQYYCTTDTPLHHGSSVTLLEPPVVPINVQSSQLNMYYHSCNGMILITYPNDDTIILWNPAIQETRIIPSPLLKKSSNTYGLKRLHNICYVSSMDDYKIVRVGQQERFKDDYDFEIFSTKRNSWKLIDQLSRRAYFEYFDQEIVIVDGIVYMIARTDLLEHSNVYDYTVKRFCLEKEEFQEDLLVPYSIQGMDTKPVMFVLGENLCLTKYLRNEKWTLDYEVWYMKKNDLRDPWIKIVTVPSIRLSSYRRPAPVNFTKNGDILFRKDGKDFAVYNSERDIFEIIEVVGLEARPFFRTAITYVESLYSPYKS